MFRLRLQKDVINPKKLPLSANPISWFVTSTVIPSMYLYLCHNFELSFMSGRRYHMWLWIIDANMSEHLGQKILYWIIQEHLDDDFVSLHVKQNEEIKLLSTTYLSFITRISDKIIRCVCVLIMRFLYVATRNWHFGRTQFNMQLFLLSCVNLRVPGKRKYHDYVNF